MVARLRERRNAVTKAFHSLIVRASDPRSRGPALRFAGSKGLQKDVRYSDILREEEGCDVL
jgi:hypothetical protein